MQLSDRTEIGRAIKKHSERNNDHYNNGWGETEDLDVQKEAASVCPE